MQGVLGATVKQAESRPDGKVSTPIVTTDQPKRCRRHLPKSMDRSLDTHFALSISRTVSPLAFLYTFMGRKGACDLFLNVDGGAEVVYGERPASCEVAKASRLVFLLCFFELVGYSRESSVLTA